MHTSRSNFLCRCCPANLRRLTVIGLTFLLVFVGSLSIPKASLAGSGEAPGSSTNTETPVYAPNAILVGIKPGADIQSLAAILTHEKAPIAVESLGAPGSAVKAPAGGAGLTSAAQAGIEKMGRIYRLSLPPGEEIGQALEALRRNPQVEFAEPDYLAELVLTPDDPLFASQWALAKIGAPAAWDVSTGSDSTVIAVIDSGIDLAHQDLAGKLWANPGEIPANGLDDDGNGKIDDVNGWNFLAGNGNLNDENGHGTQVAGVIAAQTDNAAGIAGMCWNCKLMVLKVVQPSGAVNYSDIASAVSYAAAEGAQVINLSLGGYADSQALRTAIESASATATVVAGAGNDNMNSPFYPAAYPEVISVAAVDQSDVKADFSNYGSWVDISAPGVDIQTTLAGNNAYGTQSGTSLAAPFVSGLVGLLHSTHSDWSPMLLKQQILNTSTSIDSQNPSYLGMLGSGRIQAGAALAAAPQEQMSIVNTSVNGQPGALPAPGDTFDLVLTLQNEWLPARSLVGRLSESDPYVSLPDAQGAFGDLNTDQQGSNSLDPFRVALAGNTPYSHPIPFTLQLTGSNGYSLSLAFTLTVRSGTYQISGDLCDQTWTSDKNYVLVGNTVVSAGCTLTISPGVQVKADAGIWMRVDGTLVADGTEAQPITFDTNAADGSKWAGIRFIDSSGEAVFDGSGNYLSGSILRYASVKNAETGINMTTRGVYISNVIFDSNDLGAKTAKAAARVENSKFMDNPIALQVGAGTALVKDNQFLNNATAIYAMEDDPDPTGIISPTIQDNDFSGNTSCAIFFGGYVGISTPAILSNRIVGNAGGICANIIESFNIEHNLIASTSASCTGGFCRNANDAALYIETYGGKGRVRNNTIIHNAGYGVKLAGFAAGDVVFSNNNWLGNQGYDFYLDAPSYVSVTLNANYWGGLTAQQAESRIYDCGDTPYGCGASSTVGNAVVTSTLSSPDQAAPAFVLASSASPDPLGIQQGVFDITFSREMDTSGLPSLNIHDARKGTLEPIPAITQTVTHLTKDASGRIWVGTQGGAQVFDGENWTKYTTANSKLYSNEIAGIYGASNGDVWFTAVTDPAKVNTVITRLRGTIWQSFAISNFPYDWNSAISEDNQGNIWFGAFSGVGRFDGTSWTKFSAGSELLSSEVLGIARDGQGRMWFSHTDGLSVFDGSTWTHITETSFLPYAHHLRPESLFADSQGRIWVALFNMPEATSNFAAAMYDGSAWTLYGPDNTGGLLTAAYEIHESSNGEIWILSGPSATVYNGTSWESRQISDGFNFVNHMALDLQDNLWIDSHWLSSKLSVYWRGQDFPVVDNGQWLSSTHYRATYDVSPIVPMGTYAIHVEGAAGSDGMRIAPDDSGTFQINYASTVIDDTPPSRPSIWITASSTGSLSFRWESSDPQGIFQYRYCIGTVINRCDVIGWKYTSPGTTSITLNGLLLAKGETYYITVAAQNISGLWSLNGSTWVTIGQTRIYLPIAARNN